MHNLVTLLFYCVNRSIFRLTDLNKNSVITYTITLEFSLSLSLSTLFPKYDYVFEGNFNNINHNKCFDR